MLASSAAMKPPTRGNVEAWLIAVAVPTSTGATAAGSVLGRAALSQIRKGLFPRAGGETC